MKAILTFALVLFFGGISIAQQSNNNQKVDTFQAEAVLILENTETSSSKQANVSNQQSIARLYRYKNTRVKKALFFTTKKDKPKLA